MPTFPLLQVDAFTNTPLHGNPAAVVLDAKGLTDAPMQAIAREMNLSETAFVFPSDEADFAVRFFTPTKEIPLPGHPVIATAHTLAETSRWMPQTDRPLRLATKKGVITVNRRDKPVDSLWVMTQPRPEWGAVYPEEVVAPILGLVPEQITAPPQTVSTGTPQLMVLVRDLDAVIRLRPDLPRLARMTEESDFFSVHVFTLGGYAPQTDVHARHFAPAAGVAEDPVTGSASGAMAVYLVRHGLVERRTLIAEQGHIVGRPGIIYIQVLRSGEEISGVEVGGQAVTIFRGELYL